MRRGDVENSRWDVTFNLIQRSETRTSRFKFVPLRDLVSILSGGTPNKSKPNFWNGDIPWVSPKDFGPHVIKDSEDHITIKGQLVAGLHLIPAKSILLVVRSGVLKHSLPVALTGRELTINQDLKALIPSKSIMPEFLANYFVVFGKQILPAISKHSTTVQSLNTPQLESLPIPLPPLAIQSTLAAQIEAARSSRRDKLAQADALLSGLDDWLLDKLGLKSSNDEKRASFAVHLGDLSKHKGRLDVKAYEPLLNVRTKQFQQVKIGDFVTRSQKRIDKSEVKRDDYITLSTDGTIKPKLIKKWREVSDGGLFKSQMFLAEQGQLVFSKIDLRNGAIAIVNRERVAITAEFPVYDVNNKHINSDLLVLMLRSSFFQDAMNALSSGHSGRKRINPSQFEEFIIPLPSLEIQKSIADEIHARREAARVLREEATREWDAAKTDFEAQLLSESDSGGDT